MKKATVTGKARPPILRFNIGAEDSGFFSENRKPDNAVLNAATERFSLANFQTLPPKQAEVYGTHEICYTSKNESPASLKMSEMFATFLSQ